MSKTPKVVVKKIKAYPIQGTVDVKGAKKPIEVMKLATIGLWASVGPAVVQVGQVYNVEFILPSTDLTILAPAKVLRTMDRAHPPPSKKIERLVEFQFVKPTQEIQDRIRLFLVAINQKG